MSKTETEKPAVRSQSVVVADAGLRTGSNVVDLMRAVISDVLDERITTNQANCIVNATGKLLKVVELQIKYGKPQADGVERELLLTPAPIEHHVA